MAQTLAELQAELTTVVSAISSIISGKRLTHLEIGTGFSKRVYKYQEITLDFLQAERLRLENLIGTQAPVDPLTMVFPVNSFPLNIKKGAYE
jgi:hypothetical protein